MNRSEWRFADRESFIEKIEELLLSGVGAESLSTYTPCPVEEIDHILKRTPSRLRFFTLLGCSLGFCLGFALTIYTVLDWPLITGGKDLISLPTFIIIAFELTILLGALFSLAGFLLLVGLPSLAGHDRPIEHNNDFVIIEWKEGR